MAKIVDEVTKKVKGSRYDTDKKENKFFDWVIKQSPKYKIANKA